MASTVLLPERLFRLFEHRKRNSEIRGGCRGCRQDYGEGCRIVPQFGSRGNLHRSAQSGGGTTEATRLRVGLGCTLLSVAG